jgi:hypothetical protein
MSDVDDKLQRGFMLLERAATDSDLLGVALLAIHGALEDRFRQTLSARPTLNLAERQALVRRDITGPALVEMMEQHAGLPADQRRIVLDALEIRQNFINGRPFRWRVNDMLRYARFVETVCDQRGLLDEILTERRAARAETEPIPALREPQSRFRPLLSIWNAIALALFVCVIIAGVQIYNYLDIETLFSNADAAVTPPPVTSAANANARPTPTSTARQARITGLGGGPGWLHELPNFDSNTLPIRLGEGMRVTVLEPEQTDSDGLLWRYVSVEGYEGWCPAPNLTFD